MPKPDDLIARLLAARERWVELEPGVAVKLRRPAVHQLAELRRGAEGYLDCAVDWRGVTEPLLLAEPAAQPDPPALPFDLELWRTAAGDRADWLSAVIEAIGSMINEHAESEAARRKN